MQGDPSLESYLEYEAFVIDKLQKLHTMERNLLQDEQYKSIKDVRDFEKSLYYNLEYWYLRESKVPARLEKKYNKILK